MSHRWHIAVLVPARNEEELLPRCLASVARARENLAEIATTDVVVVVDKSTDCTLEIARTMLGEDGLVLRSEFGNVGAARGEAAAAAIKRAPCDAERCWLANTDADCIVPPSWLLDQLLLAKSKLHAVAGIVDVDSFLEHDASVPDRFRRSYLIHPDGTHPHVHGANLGVRADAYLAAGGWSAVETAEDHDLWNRIRGLSLTQRADASLVVLTSGRRIGRAPKGFAGALAAHNEVASL